MENKTLSEKRKEIFDILIKVVPTKAGRIYRIIKKQDKEFIKELKEMINDPWTNGLGQCICPECWEHRDGTKETEIRTKECMFLKMFKEIDNLAGEELIKEKNNE